MPIKDASNLKKKEADSKALIGRPVKGMITSRNSALSNKKYEKMQHAIGKCRNKGVVNITVLQFQEILYEMNIKLCIYFFLF